MTRLLHPPKGVHSFQIGGADHGHEYDGEHGIDCPADVAVVDGWSADERLGDVSLRGPNPLPWHDEPEQRERLQAAHRQRLHDASWRIEEVADTAPSKADDEPSGDAFAEGKAAAEEGLGRSANPYDGRSKAGKAWSEGWDSAEK